MQESLLPHARLEQQFRLPAGDPPPVTTGPAAVPLIEASPSVPDALVPFDSDCWVCSTRWAVASGPPRRTSSAGN